MLVLLLVRFDKPVASPLANLFVAYPLNLFFKSRLLAVIHTLDRQLITWTHRVKTKIYEKELNILFWVYL